MNVNRQTVNVRINPNTVNIDRKIFDRKLVNNRPESLFDTIERSLIQLGLAHNLTSMEGFTENDCFFVKATYNTTYTTRPHTHTGQ